jgi:hypothetical protein
LNAAGGDQQWTERQPACAKDEQDGEADPGKRRRAITEKSE